MNQKILIIVGIVFALVFVLIMAIMMNTITNEANNANDQLNNVLGMTDTVGSLYSDGANVKGESVINAINSRRQLISDRDVKVTVYTGTSGNGTETPYSVDETYDQTDATKPDYINRTADFKVFTVKNSNDVVIGYVFAQSGTTESTSDSGAFDEV